MSRICGWISSKVMNLKSIKSRGYFDKMDSKCTYESAIQKLNLLQSNKASLAQARRDISSGKKCKNLEDMENYLQRIGISLEKLDELSVIHVAGTKGKGTTSAMCESILRHHGYKTGFYSSPHLVTVCERIRFDGQIITKDKFARNFHEIFDKLWASQRFEGDMPKYFAFLTVMAFDMFLREKVDVAIVEVGIGGVVDYTNILRKVAVVGITALGLDHTSILGTTLPEIAAAKAGIMKPGCEAYTVLQLPDAMAVLEQVARDIGCNLTIAPDYNAYTFPRNQNTKLPIDLNIYYTNASLAVQLSHAWMRLHADIYRNIVQKKKRFISGKKIQNIYTDIECEMLSEIKVFLANSRSNIPIETLDGLQRCRWPGRYQVVECDYASFYLDGAHTRESIEICADWFREKKRFCDKILIFSSTGDRDPYILLKPLITLDFDYVYFVVPTAGKETSQINDNFSALEQKERMSSCNNNARIWKQLDPNTSGRCSVHECVSDAIVSIKKRKQNAVVLVTGSLHLVGACLSIIDRV